MIFLFIHGDPNFNALPEIKLLEAKFTTSGNEIKFWNGPTSKLKTETTSLQDSWNSLKEMIRNLAIKEKITVIGHSFGALVLNEIIHDIQDELAKIILLSPVTDLALVDENILKLNSNDDLERFKSIRLSCKKSSVNNYTYVETHILYGLQDQFILPEEYEILKSYYPHSEVTLLENSSHYGHIEESDKFLKICLNTRWLSHLNDVAYNFNSIAETI
jgi:pimeloyl-ACP methyl ester carboxylesterase